MPLLKQILIKLKDIDVKVTTGQEVKTNEIIDGKRVYKKRMNCGAGPNNGTRSIATGVSNVTYIRAEGIATNGTMYFPLNNTRPVDGTDSGAIGMYINSDALVIDSKSDRSSYTVYVDLYYTKN